MKYSLAEYVGEATDFRDFVDRIREQFYKAFAFLSVIEGETQVDDDQFTIKGITHSRAGIFHLAEISPAFGPDDCTAFSHIIEFTGCMTEARATEYARLLEGAFLQASQAVDELTAPPEKPSELWTPS